MKKALLVLAVFGIAVTGTASNEVNASYGISVKKGYLQMQVNEGVQIDMTGESFDHRTTEVTTNPAALVISADVGVAGMAFFKNVSTNHAIMLGVTGGAPFSKLVAGEIWMGRLATNAISHYCDIAYTAAYTNISGGVTNAYPATTNVTAGLESIIIEE
jgi:hypothetical protein